MTMPLLAHLLLLPEPDQLQHEHILVTLKGINLISHATIVTKLQHNTSISEAIFLSTCTASTEQLMSPQAQQSADPGIGLPSTATCSWLDAA
jgi:hypothetical protein